MQTNQSETSRDELVLYHVSVVYSTSEDCKLTGVLSRVCSGGLKYLCLPFFILGIEHCSVISTTVHYLHADIQ